MEVQFTAEQEARLSQIADYNGIAAEQLVKQAALRLVEEDAEIRAGIECGIEQADLGQFVDHDEVVARFERLLQPK